MGISSELLEFLRESRTHPDFLKSVDTKRWEIAGRSYSQWKGRDRHSISIPRIIHQIWIGPPPPPDVMAMMKAWQDRHPEFRYSLWDEGRLNKERLELDRLFQEARNPATKSDIARYELLNRYGGVYLDVDMESVRPIDDLVEGSSFLVGCHPCPQDGNFEAGNAFLASTPGHPIMRRIIEELASIKELDETDAMRIMAQTGPLMLSKQVISSRLDSSEGILPSDYFYPWPGFMKEYSSNPRSFITENTYGIHRWNCSWMPQIKREGNERVLSSIRSKARRLTGMFLGRPSK